MDVLSAISVLEALADGCDPATGERLDNESVLHQREVIRTLQFAIDKLRKDAGISLQAYNTDDLDLDLTEIQTAIQLFHDQHYPPAKSRLTSFFSPIANSGIRHSHHIPFSESIRTYIRKANCWDSSQITCQEKT